MNQPFSPPGVVSTALRVAAAAGLTGMLCCVAPMVLFLCGEGAAKITGQIISINGGLNA